MPLVSCWFFGGKFRKESFFKFTDALDARRETVNDPIFVFGVIAMNILLAVLAWGMSGIYYSERADILCEFLGAKKCFRPKVARPQFHLWNFLRAALVVSGNIFMIKAFLQGGLSDWAMLGVLLAEAALFMLIHKLMRFWYKRDLAQCRIMHRTCPKDSVPPLPPGSEQLLLVAVVCGEREFESDRW